MSIDYINESYFAVLGLTGAGKSSFLNAISDTESCEVGKKGKSCTQKNQLVTFVFNNHRFNALDTPGLDDSDNNDEKVNTLKNILREHPRIKKIIFVKKYNDLRLPMSMQSAISTFMEAFPLKTFWDHVIIVNTWANPNDETFQDYLEENDETYLEKLLKCQKLLKIMEDKQINVPSNLKEYYVCSRKIKKYTEIADEFNKIKNDIRSSKLMFKDVQSSEILERSKESEKNKGFYIVTKYRTITCIDFNNKKTELEQIEEEKEVVPKDCQVISTEEKSEFMEKDEIRFIDIATLGIARVIRNTKKYKVYKINTYQVGDKQVKGDKIFVRVEFR